MAEICGTTPEARVFRRKTFEYAASETTPSWMRAPPESFNPMTGAPFWTARAMTLHILSALDSASELQALADLVRVRLGERAAEDGEVLREHVDRPSVDRSRAADDAVSGKLR